ncbi:MFS transporter [Fructilactobacillus cliffordii]|uniref:MFS transporter n=1 Tax=Fructilactobacillus cliffordii TaxID=2940299 RepID=A0A9Q8ZXX8_9LACO|nr:MFS transporter [Fructilactobacillus cliffordii]USS89536.1 MFS transporter [Fructilactobacillus cliffordii]
MKPIKQVALNDLASSIVTQAFSIYTFWYIASHLYNQGLISLLGGLELLTVLLAPVGGVVADTWSRVKIMQIISLIRTILLLAFVVLLLVTQQLSYLVIATGTGLSILSAFYNPAVEAIIPDYADSDAELVQNNTIVNVANQTAIIVASVVAGLFTFLPSNLLAYGFLLLLLAIATISILRLQDYSHRQPADYPWDNFRLTKLGSEFKAIVKIPVIRVLLPYAIILNLSFWSFWFLTPLYLTTYLQRFRIAFSLQELIIGIAAITCGMVVGRYTGLLARLIRWYPLFLLLQGSGFVLFLLVMQITSNLLVQVVSFCLAWLMYGTFNFLTGLMFVTAVQRKLQPEQMGKTLGTIFSIFGILSPLASLITGVVHQPTTQLMLGLVLPMILVPLVMLFDGRVKRVLQSDH